MKTKPVERQNHKWKKLDYVNKHDHVSCHYSICLKCLTVKHSSYGQSYINIEGQHDRTPDCWPLNHLQVGD